jgi:hypothetical protein
VRTGPTAYRPPSTRSSHTSSVYGGPGQAEQEHVDPRTPAPALLEGESVGGDSEHERGKFCHSPVKVWLRPLCRGILSASSRISRAFQYVCAGRLRLRRDQSRSARTFVGCKDAEIMQTRCTRRTTPAPHLRLIRALWEADRSRAFLLPNPSSAPLNWTVRWRRCARKCFTSPAWPLFKNGTTPPSSSTTLLTLRLRRRSTLGHRCPSPSAQHSLSELS